MLDWVHRNGKILLAVRLIQAFATSYVSIFFAIYLSTLGLTISQIGLVLTGGLLSSTVFNLGAGSLETRLGRRRLLIFFGLINVVAGMLFALSTSTALLISVAIVASMGYAGGFGAPQMLERVIMAQSCEDRRRTEIYAIRSTIGSLSTAAGSLFTGLLVVLTAWGLSENSAYQMMFGVYAGLNIVTVLLYILLDSEAEIKLEQAQQVSLCPETKRYLVLLSVLFCMDTLGGAFITQSLVAYWFFERFGLAMDRIGLIFSVSSLLSAISYMAAARISRRIGLINTMVYSHLPSSITLAAIPYMPNLWTSLSLYLGRSLLSNMDVPTRDSYTMAIVKPEERARFQSLLNIPRSIVMAIGPSLAGYMMQFIGLGTPFLFGGIIKSVYDIALWYTFKDIKPPEEK
jgi:MFS family permease